MPNTEDGSPIDGEAFECWTVLAGLAAITSRVRPGSLVSPVTFHHPVVLAKRATTVDHISGGRAVLGLGAGWQINEHAAIGVELPPPGERVRRFEEAIEIVTRVRTERRVTTDGTHFVATDLPFDPKPVQHRLPVMVGTAGQRMLGITARWADEWNTWGDPDTVAEATARFRAACEREHRDPDGIHRSAQALVFMTPDDATTDKLRGRTPAGRSLVGTSAQLVDLVGAYVELGLDELIVPDFTLGTTASERADTLAAFAEQVLPAFA
jgi:alkanesulfonate monooxygenase SsuD/methylene tetrahydromethanopterin reductase-like flavin-dependent oxidoreductase (luciferase family)